MVSLGSNILILFAFAAILAFFFPLIKDGVYKELSVKPLKSGLLPLVIVLIAFGACFGFASFLGAPIVLTLPSFAGAAVLFYLLSRIGLTAQLRAVLLTVAAVIFTALLPTEGGNLAAAAALMGLLSMKFTDTLFLGGDRSLEDIIGPLCWLGGVLWMGAYDDQSQAPTKDGLLLGIISICFALRIIQRPFMSDDRWLLKRVVLATSGGLGVLLVITKLLLAMDMTPLALLIGGGMFATYLFQNIPVSADDGEDFQLGTAGVKLLIVIGVLTLVATRFFGMFGLVALSPVALVAPRFSMAQFPGLFFAVRALLQVFISVYNSNITGINITHAYTGAAMYAGFIIIASLALILRDIKDKRLLLTMFLGAAGVVPIVSNYYLHAEPTSSLLAASVVAAVIFAVLGPAFERKKNGSQFETLLLVPAAMAAVGITYSGLIDAGNNATNVFKATILAYAIGGAIVCFLVGWFVFKHLDKGRAVPAAGE